MTTHRKKKSETRDSASQQKPRTLPTLPHDVSPAHLEQGEALERVLRERAALPPAVDLIPGLTENKRPSSPEQWPTDSRNQTENVTANEPKAGAPLHSQVPLQAFQTDFFCDSRTQIAAAAVSEQIQTCGIDSGIGPSSFGLVAQTRFREDSRAQRSHTESSELLHGLDSRLEAMRTILLKELQSSFADLQSFQKTVWAEQKGLLQGLSRELRPLVDNSPATTPPASTRVDHQTSVSSLDPRHTASPEAGAVVDRMSAVEVSLIQQTPLPPHQQPPAAVLPERLHRSFDRPDSNYESSRSSAPRTWEDIRRELLSECEAREEHQHDENSDTAFPDQESFFSRSNTPSFELPRKLTEPLEKPVLPAAMPDEEFLNSIPEAVDPESLSDGPLREAFLERETFLSLLINRFRSRQESRATLLNAEQLRGLLADCPVDMARLVQQSLRGLDELTRLGELELAFERARLARLRSQLQQSRQQIEVRARQLGLTLNDDGTLGSASQTSSKSSSRRWLTKLGLGHDRR